MKVECPWCGYDGDDLAIGRYPISFPMFCAKCRMKFNPKIDENDIENIKYELAKLEKK